MPAWLGFWEILLVLGLVLLFFGARKIPQIGRGLGLGIRNFKGELKEPEARDEPPGEPRDEGQGGASGEARGRPPAGGDAEPPGPRS